MTGPATDPALLAALADLASAIREHSRLMRSATTDPVVEEIGDAADEPLARFLRECCEFDPVASVSLGALWARYLEFLRVVGEGKVYSSQTMFNRELAKSSKMQIGRLGHGTGRASRWNPGRVCD